MDKYKIEKVGEIEGEIDGIKKRLADYYSIKNAVDEKGNSMRGLKTEETNLERLEAQNIKTIEAIQAEIDSIMAKCGIEVNTDDGTIKQDNMSNVDNETMQKLQGVKEKLDAVIEEYEKVSTALVGEADKKERNDELADVEDEKDNDEQNEGKDSRQRKEGVKEKIVKVIRETAKRDVLAKKVLEARVNLEATKDNMDMDAAKHVVAKNKMVLQLEQAKLELASKIARGSTMESLSVRANQIEIEGLINAIGKKEREFEERRLAYALNFEEGKNLLKLTQNESMLEREDAKDGKNKYVRNLVYSEDGILNGTQCSITRDGRTAAEEEIYDERGVMILDVADIVNVQRTINIDGTVVKCITNFEGHDVDDAYYIGETEKLCIDSNGGKSLIEDKPDLEKEVHSTETGEPAQINEVYRSEAETLYEINGIRYVYLSDVPEEERERVARALIMMGYDVQNGKILLNGFNNVRKAIADIAKEKQRDDEMEESEIGEIKTSLSEDTDEDSE